MYVYKVFNGSLQCKIRQRWIEVDTVCPICQNEFFCHQRFPVTFCRKGCGNNVHVKCIKVWKDHQVKEKHTGLPVLYFSRNFLRQIWHYCLSHVQRGVFGARRAYCGNSA